MNKYFKSILIAALIICASIVTYIICYLNRPISAEDIERAKVSVIHKTAFAVIADGREVCYFSKYDAADSTFTGLTQHIDSAFLSVTLSGVWINSSSFYPSAEGMVLTVNESPVNDSIDNVLTDEARIFLETNLQKLQRAKSRVDAIHDEVKYYLRCHSIYDNEFGAVANYSYSIEHDSEHLDSMISVIDSVLTNANNIEIDDISRYYIDIKGKRREFTKVAASASPVTEHVKLNEKGVVPVILESDKVATTPDENNTLSTPVYSDGDFSFLADIDFFRHKHKMEQMIADGKLSFRYINIDKAEADTIYFGHFIDLDGNSYTGKMTETGVPKGYGVMEYANGERYEGEWADSVRQGSGFLVAENQMVKAGDWKGGKYKGEKMTHAANRVYGIDISRYQHEIGKKKYPINWKCLRITSLGNQHNTSVSGDVSFPVRFVYIKSTQSTNIKSAYYQQDSKDARKNGFLCGAYHFFSMKVSGKAQAEYFLSNTQILSGDMPPVLDVEPSEKEISSNGGEESMFEKMREWLNIVEKKVGKRPILYVSQTFIKTHLVNAPDLCKNYQVWIARYNSYRPDVKLLFWQLTPYGRVEGIHGNVDINVFNGYDDQFEF